MSTINLKDKNMRQLQKIFNDAMLKGNRELLQLVLNEMNTRKIQRG